MTNASENIKQYTQITTTTTLRFIAKIRQPGFSRETNALN